MADINFTPVCQEASSSACKNNDFVFDVFINHRGPDVKKTLATDLYHRLCKHELRVFLDQEELEQGENITRQIKCAIRTASLHIAIFSRGYADSAWCLKELQLMLESGATIIPVFYGVKPSELRWTQSQYGLFSQALSILLCILQCKWGQNGVYARALRRLEEKKTCNSQPRYNCNTIKNWRKALSDVAEIKGFDFHNYDGDERKLLEQVVEGVSEKVKRTLNVSRYPTGLEQKVKDFENKVLLKKQGGKTGVIGIVGLGGVGKTTLAKEIFNRSNYNRSCFLFDVRENAARSSLVSLQCMLLNSLTRSNVQIHSIDDGIDKLKKYLVSSHALIILDDVDHPQQLDALLLPLKDILHKDSLIIITSRDEDVLTSSGIEESSIYELTGLNRQHSQELFCCHAFDQSHPAVGFEQVVNKFLDACDGLPLSLKVFGALLRGKHDLVYWKAQLDKISKILPSDIQSRLKISYDGLDPEEKQIFLDVACFFIGEDRDTAIRIWDRSSWGGWLGFRNLQKKCLVEVDSKNLIKMHDHLRDLGREMADKEPPRCPRRLWRLSDNLESLSDQSSVRGIKNLGECRGLATDMSSLQLLSAEGSCVESILSDGQSPKLIWLCWYKCPYSYLPSWVPMKNLLVLKIKGDKLETLWQDESQAPLQLLELDIAATHLVKIPKSIGQLNHLEKIVLKPGVLSEMSLEALPEEICHLQSLKHLELKHCSRIKWLPDSFGKLTNLQHIDLFRCCHLKMLPYSFGNLRNLHRVFLNECYELERLPESFGNLINLQHIDFSNCSNLQMLPDSFGNLSNIQHMDFCSCSNLQKLPNSFGMLTNLQHIDLSNCSNLEMLPNSFGSITNLQYIDLSDCSKLQTLPDSFENLTNLQHIDLSNCSSLQNLSDSFGNLISLQHINLSRCSNLLIVPESFGNLTNLQHIDLSRCSNLQMIPSSLGNLRNLQHFDLSDWFNLQALPDWFGNLSSLQHIDLSDCSNLQMLPDSFGNLRNLEHINLSGSNLHMLPDSFGNLTNLQHLDLSTYSNLQRLPDSFENLTNLQHLDLSRCSNLQRPPGSFRKT